MKLSQPIPVLRILDEAKAREFYVDFLAFSIDWSHRFDDNAPLYAQVSRDGCVFHLSEHYGDCNSGGAIRIQIDDIDGLHHELLQKQYKYARPGVGDTPWHTREMKITDPFGNHLIFYRNLRAPRDLDLNIAGGTGMSPVGMTSQWIAASRALETESADPLYRDPLARELAGSAGFAMMNVMRAAMGAPDTANPDPYLTIRTRYLDDAMLAAVGDGSITQAVILAAGMDMRAFRLDWPAGLTLFEVDRNDVFDHKEPVLERSHARASCDRRIVRADLSQEGWVDDLVAAGYDPARPAAILVEGLLMYLDEGQVKQLLASLGTIAPKGSWIGADLVNTTMLASTFTAAYMKKLAEVGCPWKWAIDDPDQFLADYGWHGKAVVPGQPDASYGRWPFPAMPRTVPGMPRAFFVHARKDAPP